MLRLAPREKSRRADVTTRPRKLFAHAVKQARLECETGFLVLLKARPLAPAPADFSAPDIFSHNRDQLQIAGDLCCGPGVILLKRSHIGDGSRE